MNGHVRKGSHNPILRATTTNDAYSPLANWDDPVLQKFQAVM